MEALTIIINVLNKSFGIFIFGDEHDDFSLSDYISDSLAFIQFIIAIEEEIDKELPDDFLNYEILESAKGFAEKLDSFINSI